MPPKPRPTNGDPITIRRSDLIKMLREDYGLSKRKAAAAVKGVFFCMTRALRRGEEVELPVGSIRAVHPQPGRRKRVFQKFKNIQTGKLFFTVVNHPQRLIQFEPDPQTIVRGPAALPPRRPPTAEMVGKGEELEQLYSRLMGRDVNVRELQSLLDAVVDPNRPWIEANREESLDRLLRRLRQILQDQRPFTNLADAIRGLYWIR